MIAVYVIVALVLVGVAASVRILKQYERGVQFRLGKVKDGARGPGLIFIIPLVDRVTRVSLRIVTMPIQSQGSSRATTSAWTSRPSRISVSRTLCARS